MTGWEAEARATSCLSTMTMDNKMDAASVIVLNRYGAVVTETAILGCIFGHSMAFSGSYDQDRNLEIEGSSRWATDYPTPLVVPNGAFMVPPALKSPAKSSAVAAADSSTGGQTRPTTRQQWDDIPSPMALASYCGPLRPAGTATSSMHEPAKVGNTSEHIHAWSIYVLCVCVCVCVWSGFLQRIIIFVVTTRCVSRSLHLSPSLVSVSLFVRWCGIDGGCHALQERWPV